MRKYGVGHPTMHRALESAWPQPRKKLPPWPTRLDPFKLPGDEMLRADPIALRKQRHTAVRVFDRLVDEHRVAVPLRGTGPGGKFGPARGGPPGEGADTPRASALRSAEKRRHMFGTCL